MMTDKINEMIRFYHSNKDFKRYVDEGIKTYGGDVNSMMRIKTVEAYYKSLQKGECNYTEETS